jgi:hypothetical protein
VVKYSKLNGQTMMSIKNSFEPVPKITSQLCSLGVEIWRLKKKLQKINEKLNQADANSINFTLDKVSRLLRQADIEIIDLTNQKYIDGLNVDILSYSEGPETKNTIIETVEPTIKYKNSVIKRAKIIVSR